MPYTDAARALRQCTAMRRDGERCRQFAPWDAQEQKCVVHLGRTRVPHRGLYLYRQVRTLPCTCAAYAFRHRPGGGKCRWPDAPEETHPTPQGQRSRWARWIREAPSDERDLLKALVYLKGLRFGPADQLNPF